jgi:hypothetical protein
MTVSAVSQANQDLSAAYAARHDELGPIDLVVIAFPAGASMTGEAVPLLLDLVDRGIIRVLDALFVQRKEDGTFSGFDAKGLDAQSVGDFTAFEGASSGLLGDEDAAAAAAAIEPGTAAVLILYENHWAAPFAAAVRRNGGVLLDNQRIPHQAVIDPIGVSRRQAERWSRQWSDHPPVQRVGYTKPAPAAPARDTAAQLKDLADLKQQGILTEQEFEAQKARILAG